MEIDSINVSSGDSSTFTFVKSPGPELTFNANIKFVGGYRLGSGDTYYIQINLTKKPNWFHRFMMKICFGFRWVDQIV